MCNVQSLTNKLVLDQPEQLLHVLNLFSCCHVFYSSHVFYRGHVSPQIGDLHVRFAQNKGQTAQLDIHHHELSLNAKEIDLHTHLPLPQIFIRIEKVLLFE